MASLFRLMKCTMIVVLFVSGLSAYDGYVGGLRDSLNEPVDVEVFTLLKNELESSKKVLITIRDSQNPAFTQTALSVFGRVLKELAYILGAVTLGGGSVVLGASKIMHVDVERILNNPTGQGVALIILPGIIVSVIIAYVFLKMIFGRLLAGPQDEVAANIKDSLALIEQTINKLDYEIKKIEKIIRGAQVSGAHL